ncbi:hypothetical protein JCM3765_003658 [Sporobolomyces pararoseus]
MATSPHLEVAESERAIKRRRTSSGSSSSTTLHSQSPQVTRSAEQETKFRDKGKGRSRAERLAGFDDEEEELVDQVPQLVGQVARQGENEDENEEDDYDELCAICLAPIDNKTVVFPCHHGQFCWNCIRAWTDQSRKCPLCLGPIEHLIHNIRSPKDYSTYHLLPLHTLPSSSSSSLPAPRSRRPPSVSSSSSLPRHALYGRQAMQNLDSPTPRERLEEIALERRKYIYREGLYAKHVASNRYTGFKPFSPQTFSLNSDLKAKVIKFIRRELQVFPAVDISFLTTYLISIASQLDLRSPAALRLVSDFLSESDAQHLVHEIVSFARSPFTSLEGYDRFIQYGRPEKRIETEKMVFDEPPIGGKVEEIETRDEVEPRFAKNMVTRREEGEERRRNEQGNSNDHRLEGGLRPRSITPPPRSPTRRRDSFSRGGGRPGRNENYSDRLREPDWRDRDERYTGSYYRHSESRKDRGKGFRERDGVDERRVRRNSGRKERRESFGARDYGYRDRGKGRRYSRSPSPTLDNSYDRRRYSDYGPRSISPPPHSPRRRRNSHAPSRSRSRSRPRSPLDQPPSLPSRRSRSPTPTRLASQAERTPTPPPQPEGDNVDSEYQDAISLSAPNLSPRPQSPTPMAEPESNSDEEKTLTRPTPTMPFKPTLSIFGAARKTLLGNGNIVTISNEGKVQLQVAGSAGGKTSEAGGGAGKEKGKRKEAGSGPSKREKRILEERYRPVAAPPSLLSRLGPAPPKLVNLPSSEFASPVTTKVGVVGNSPTTPSASTTAASLKTRLQERLTAEYRQALLALTSSPAPTPSSSAKKDTTIGGGGNKVDLRALLQSRLQAEKALAYDSAQRNASSSSAPSSLDFTSSYSLISTYPSPSKTTFSQATKDLLLMRLEEERLLAQEQQQDFYSHDSPYSSSPTLLEGTSPSTPPTPTLLAKSKPSNETDLKAKLLEKRKQVVEEELKKRSGELKEKLMRDKLLKQKQLLAEKKKMKELEEGKEVKVAE